jgi:hypothetical protein
MPYEKRILDVIKTGGSGAEKKVGSLEGFRRLVFGY